MGLESQPACLGLIGGLGPGATIHYYQQLLATHAAHGRTPHLLIIHADMSRVLKDVADGNLSGLAHYLAGLIERLAGGGATLAAISAIAPHICIPQLVPLSRLPIVDIVEETARCVRDRKLAHVALFGTRFAMETRLFGRLRDVDVVMPRPDELDHIHDTDTRIAREGAGTSEQADSLRRLADTLRERDGVEAIVLAGTDLALLFDEASAGFPAIDCVRLHVDAIVRRLIEQGPKT